MALTMISIWEKESFYRPTDLVIAGSGLMGLWTAWEIKRHNPGLSITIVEAQSIPAAASTRNAGFACFGSPSEILADIESLGEKEVFTIFELRFKGIKKIQSLFEDKNIGFERCGGYEVYAEETGWQGHDLQDKLTSINRNLKEVTGEEKTFVVANQNLQKQGLEGFVSMSANRLEGGLHSGLLVQGLQELLVKNGVRFLFGHRVENVFGEAGHIQVGLLSSLRRLVNLPCRSFLWATNAGLSRVNGLESTIQPARGQVIVSPPIEGFNLQGTFHYQEGYYYFRNIGNRLLIGGARNEAFAEEATDNMETTKLIRENLEAFIARHIPQAAAYLSGPGWMHWAGIMGMSNPKKPFVSQISPGVYAAFACNGMGVALTPIVAEWAAEHLTRSLT